VPPDFGGNTLVSMARVIVAPAAITEEIDTVA